MVYSSSRFKYQSLIALLNANLLSVSTLFCVHPEFLVILIKNLKVMFLILYCSIFKELCAALATAYLLYHIHSSLSSTFWNFLNFFFTVLNFLPVGHRASAVSSFRFFKLISVPSTALFLAVQAVSGFLKYPLFLCPLVWVLVYYITLFELCQQLFHFNFAQMVLNCYIPRLCKMQTTTIYSFLLSTFSYQQPHCYMLKTRVFFP